MTCPSLYDLRNLFQVNVEEGRHLWAMVYLLHAYFGRDGREEAEELLTRHSGDARQAAHPRHLQRADRRLAQLLHVHLFHRPRRQVPAEEPGRERVRPAGAQLPVHADRGSAPHVRRRQRDRPRHQAHARGDEGACARDDPDAVRNAGAIDLPTMQRYINFWFSSSLDLFGAEISSNAASYFATGIKGRPDEARFDDHRGAGRLRIEVPDGKGGVIPEEVPMRNAMNEVTRAAYVKDCEIGVQRWNRLIREAGHDFRLTLPSPRFRRSVGAWAGIHTDPAGQARSPPKNGGRRQHDWLPSEQDRAFVGSLMQRVTEPGKIAGWIAPPDGGINNLGARLRVRPPRTKGAPHPDPAPRKRGEGGARIASGARHML